MSLITRQLVDAVRAQFALDWNGIHGVSHWARVRANGVRLARSTGARTDVVELFAFLHDARRLNDGYDPDHGRRGAELAADLRGTLVHLDDAGFELLRIACTHHSEGLTHGDSTVLTCWDADRLDLGRVGIEPWPERLCTAAARDPETLRWAWRRSLG